MGGVDLSRSSSFRQFQRGISHMGSIQKKPQGSAEMGMNLQKEQETDRISQEHKFCFSVQSQNKQYQWRPTSVARRASGRTFSHCVIFIFFLNITHPLKCLLQQNITCLFTSQFLRNTTSLFQQNIFSHVCFRKISSKLPASVKHPLTNQLLKIIAQHN